MDLITEITNYPQMTNDALSSTKNINDIEITESDTSTPEQQPYTKLEEIDLLSSIGRDIGVDLEKYVQPVPDVVAMEPLTGIIENTNKFIDDKKIDTTIIDCRKKEKMTRNHQARRRQRKNDNKYRQDAVDKVPGSFDIYNIETAMPKIDLDVIESHLRAAREEERRVSNIFIFFFLLLLIIMIMMIHKNMHILFMPLESTRKARYNPSQVLFLFLIIDKKKKFYVRSQLIFILFFYIKKIIMIIIIILSC